VLVQSESESNPGPVLVALMSEPKFRVSKSVHCIPDFGVVGNFDECCLAIKTSQFIDSLTQPLGRLQGTSS